MNKKLKNLIFSATATACGLSAIIGGCAATPSSSHANLTSYSSEGKLSVIDKPQTVISGIANCGFETGDISGWTVEYGDAFDNDSVSSVKSFSYSYDAAHREIPMNHTGNWYLSGKGFDGKRPHGYIGALRSETFVLLGDGSISMKLGGGAITRGKGENAEKKSPERLCYVGVYQAATDRMIAKFINEDFLEHVEAYVNVEDYINGVYNTDNFYTYTKYLDEYLGQELYLRIVDNDTDVYYGYLSVDDIRIGDEHHSQQEDGTYFVKTRKYQQEAVRTSRYDVINGGFETGSLAGWTIVRGSAFSDDGVNASRYWWNESITYDRDGNYHYGLYEPSATGVMRSSDFVIGGSGYISYKLGGCSNQDLTYLRFMVKEENGDVEVARLSNFKYWDYEFPFVENGMRLLNLVQYYADFSAYMGKTMYIEVVDNNYDYSDLGCIVLDSVITYYPQKPQWYSTPAFEAHINVDAADLYFDNEYQVKNGGFESGNLSGWTMEGNIGEVSSSSTWWDEELPYNKKGAYLFTGLNRENGTGTLTSSEFTVGGSGDITFRMGGGRDATKCYISIIDAFSGKELARFRNSYFWDNGINDINGNSFLANMVSYRANLYDLGIERGTKVKIRITDNAINNWGLITCDSFVTYYADSSHVPSTCIPTVNILDKTPQKSTYQIENGGFESGSLTGWTVVSGNINTNCVSSETCFWYERIPYNNGGVYFFNGQLAAPDENDTFIIRSTNFTLGGSGYITFKMGGRTAAVNVKRAADNSLVATYKNTAYSDPKYSYVCVDRGFCTATMTTFAADLSEEIGTELHIELCDLAESNGAWRLAFFDDIITYYETAPSLSSCDLVALSARCSYTGNKFYNLPWVQATPVNEE